MANAIGSLLVGGVGTAQARLPAPWVEASRVFCL